MDRRIGTAKHYKTAASKTFADLHRVQQKRQVLGQQKAAIAAERSAALMSVENLMQGAAVEHHARAAAVETDGALLVAAVKFSRACRSAAAAASGYAAALEGRLQTVQGEAAGCSRLAETLQKRLDILDNKLLAVKRVHAAGLECREAAEVEDMCSSRIYCMGGGA